LGGGGEEEEGSAIGGVCWVSCLMLVIGDGEGEGEDVEDVGE